MLRIIDNRKDYYDNVQYANGFVSDADAKPFVLVRKGVGEDIHEHEPLMSLRPKTVVFGIKGFGNSVELMNNVPAREAGVDARSVCVVFANVVYNGVQFTRHTKDSLGFDKFIQVCVWSQEAMESFIVKHISTATGVYRFVDPGHWYDERRYLRGDTFFAPTPVSLDVANYLADKKAPIAFIEPGYRGVGHVVTLNYGSLDTLQFYQVKDAYTAYQELDQWFGSIAFPENPMVTISDEVKLEKRGFDKKISFRKRKGD